MKINEWLIIWLAFGGFFVVAAIGGDHWCAVMALFSGYMAGRSVGHKREAGE